MFDHLMAMVCKAPQRCVSSSTYHRAVPQIFQRFQSDQRGNVIVMAALLLPLIVGAAGAAVVYSNASAGRTKMQQALDAAVLAGVIANYDVSVAQNAFQSNVTSRLMSASIASFTVDGAILSGTASSTTANPFNGILGTSKTIPIGVTAAATTTRVPICVLGLNTLDSGSFDMNGNAKFNAPNCAVQANTSNGKGMTQEGDPTAVAAKFGVSGGHTGSNYSTPPQDGSAAVADPYANMPFPSYSACDPQNKALTIKGGSATLFPGTYCGGITIDSQANVVLQPGIYVMVGGPFWLKGGSTVTGQNVMIAFTGSQGNGASTLYVWGDSTLNLTSPTSGTYANMQFFQDPNDINGRGAWVSIGGNGNTSDASKATWDGVAYFPTANFWVFGNTVVNVNSPSLAIVAAKIWDQGNATLNVTHNNPRNLAVSQTYTSGGARLIR